MHIFRPDIQIDELHWEKRPVRFIENLENQDLKTASKYLTHPALPTNFIFGYSFEFCKHAQLALELKVLKDRINCGRLINSSIQFITYLFVYATVKLILPDNAALIGVATAMFSPLFVGIGTMLHLDAFVGLTFVLATFFMVRSNRLSSTLGAGLSLGLGFLTKISFCVFIFAQTVSLLLQKQLNRALVIGITSLLCFHMLPSLWLDAYRYNKTSEIIKYAYLASIGVGFMFSTLLFLIKKKSEHLLVVFLISLLIVIYLTYPLLLQNFLATLFRVTELPFVPHDTGKYDLIKSFVSRLTIIDQFCILVSLFCLIKKEYFRILFPSVVACVLFFIPEKQSMRYVYPALLVLIAFGGARVTQLMHNWLIKLTPLFLNFFLFYLAGECTNEFSNFRLFGYSDHRQFFPTCGVASALQAVPQKKVRVVGFMPLFRRVNQRVNANKQFFPATYLAPTEYLITVVDAERRLRSFFPDQKFDLLHEFGFAKRPLVRVYFLKNLQGFPLTLIGRQLSNSQTRRICNQTDCYFVPKNQKIEFYLKLLRGYYSYEIKLESNSNHEPSLSLEGPIVVNQHRQQLGSVWRIGGVFYVPEPFLVKFESTTKLSKYSPFVIDVLRNTEY
ncbi:MAG: glycosyltransferase family 39 protein [Deltaproteobacteria bacterium]|nr:glycosyltransferase family 39 protein [Deltaproteobacteria bacterium]